MSHDVELSQLLNEQKNILIRMEKLRDSMCRSSSNCAFFLGCHDKMDHLAPHLDICKWTGFPAYVILSGPYIPNHPEPVRHIRNLPVFSSPNQGAGIALLESIRWAGELNIKKICYRNCDDWVLNRAWVAENFKTEAQLLAYNWLTHNQDTDFAVNENFMDVEFWSQPDVLECGFKHFTKLEFNVETNFANWRREVGATWLRLEGSRESCGGIGAYLDDPDDWDSSRWYNCRWRLLGHHDMLRKYQRYLTLRNHYGIPGIEELEAMPRFAAWLKLFA